MASSKSFRVQVQRDYLSKLAQGQPAQCLAELSWNALDAESTKVEIDFIRGEFGVDQIKIKDNGHAMWFEDAERLFSALGGSWKAAKKQTDNKNRFLHGQEGKGRFKSFSLANYVEWQVVCEQNGQFFEYTITGASTEMDHFHISEPQPTDLRKTGVTVVLSDIEKQHRFFDTKIALETFAPIFAQYLNWYSEIEVLIDGESISADQAIVKEYKYDLGKNIWGSEEYPAELQIVEWKTNVDKGLYFSNDQGFPLDRYAKPIKLGGSRKYTAYLCSGAVTKMFNSGILSIHEMDENFNFLVEKAIGVLRDHFADLDSKESLSYLESLKEKKIYPYSGEAKNKEEKNQRMVFDHIIVDMSRYLSEFSTQPQRLQGLQLSMLKDLLEMGPKYIENQLPSLIGLPESKLKKWKTRISQL